MFSDPPGTNSALFKFGQPWWCSLCLAASFSTKGCGGVLLPDSPKAHNMITTTAFTPMSTAHDVNGTTCGCTSLRGPTLRAVCCSAAPNNEVLRFQVLFRAALLFLFVFWGHLPSHSSDIMDKNNPAYTYIIKSAFLQLGNVSESHSHVTT